MDDESFRFEVGEWSECLRESLQCLRDVMRERMKKAGEERKIGYDKKSVKRELHVGDSVWCRGPGMNQKLKESWHGPYQVCERINAVNYQVELGRGRKKSSTLII